MKIQYDTIKIEMGLNETLELRSELTGMINEINTLTVHLGGYFDETSLKEKFPTINQLIGKLNIKLNEDLPF